MTARAFFGLWPNRVSLSLRRFMLRRAIASTERDLSLTQREIAEKNEARRHLTERLMNLRLEQRSLGG